MVFILKMGKWSVLCFSFNRCIGIDLGNKNGKRSRTDAGKGVILKSGPASVVLSYLKRKKQLIFNLLCKHSYYVILPSISDTLKIRQVLNFEGDWFKWTHIIPKLRATIDGVRGSYAGECTFSKGRGVPNGRGMFETSDKLILGYV